MKILVTGVTGFVGQAVARNLIKSHSVAGLTRNASAVQNLQDKGILPIVSDLLQVQEQHLQGYDIVIHCAAYVEEWGSRKDFFDTNVLGTERILDVAKKAGVRRFIFIGTEAAFFIGQDLWNIDESIPYPKKSPYLYSSTKAEAERLVLAAASSEFHTVSLRPRFVWGPGDKSVLPTIINMIAQNRFVWIDRGNFQISTTYIDNLVRAVELAVGLKESHRYNGQAYFIADEGTISLRDFLTLALATQKVIPPARSLPKRLARSAAFIVETTWKILRLRSKPPLIQFSIAMMSANCTVNTEKSKQDLRYFPPVARVEGLRRMGEGEMPW